MTDAVRIVNLVFSGFIKNRTVVVARGMIIEKWGDDCVGSKLESNGQEGHGQHILQSGLPQGTFQKLLVRWQPSTSLVTLKTREVHIQKKPAHITAYNGNIPGYTENIPAQFRSMNLKNRGGKINRFCSRKGAVRSWKQLGDGG